MLIRCGIGDKENSVPYNKTMATKIEKKTRIVIINLWLIQRIGFPVI